jgi:hypothetical protein
MHEMKKDLTWTACNMRNAAKQNSVDDTREKAVEIVHRAWRTELYLL